MITMQFSSISRKIIPQHKQAHLGGDGLNHVKICGVSFDDLSNNIITQFSSSVGKELLTIQGCGD